MASYTAAALAADLTAALGPRLLSLVQYGSTARPAAPPGSPVDVLLICDRVDDAVLTTIEAAVRRWMAAGHPPPLVFSAREWRSSTDTFAVEYADIRAAHRVLAGGDPWIGIAVDRMSERRQLERELRGKLLRLRQGYLASRGDGRTLEALARDSIGGWLTMLRAALRLAGRTVPDAPTDVVRASADLMGFAPEPVASLVAAARGSGALGLVPGDPRVVAYLAAVARTADYVDSL